jgi:hypothetical protein
MSESFIMHKKAKGLKLRGIASHSGQEEYDFLLVIAEVGAEFAVLTHVDQGFFSLEALPQREFRIEELVAENEHDVHSHSSNRPL